MSADPGHTCGPFPPHTDGVRPEPTPYPEQFLRDVEHMERRRTQLDRSPRVNATETIDYQAERREHEADIAAAKAASRKGRTRRG